MTASGLSWFNKSVRLFILLLLSLYYFGFQLIVGVCMTSASLRLLRICSEDIYINQHASYFQLMNTFTGGLLHLPD